MYRQRPSILAGAFVWTRRSAADAAPGTLRILPDGCIDLLYVDGGLQVAGPDSAASLVADVPGRHYTAVRFPPGVGAQLLGLPAREILDQRPMLDQIWPTRVVRSCEKALARSDNPAGTLERLVLARSERTPVDRWPTLVTRLLRQGNDIRTVAGELGWGERRLHRGSLDAFGYSPQRLRRILRFEEALAMARTSRRLAEVAAACGYADQAHLAKEARALAGVPMSQLT